MQGLKSLINDLEASFDPCLYIESLNSGMIKKLYEWQSLVIRSTAQFILINGARRAGKSAVISTIPTHTAKTKPHSITLIIAPTQKQSLEDMRYVKQLARGDAQYPRLVRDSDSQIELSNGSRIIVLPATEVAARS